ncbi:MAG: hypothetical protein UY41_C0013G0016 [Candidatus Moranbacteria bacterium GW2011_GWE1_49_15]|nr:MAG: hypothetical protein UX75_C0007G0017 [Candidatus Moranbacteria bacterium GW2011_GWE2_47_10]KKW06851.1 MAG: hypothetical protein UY41_C0013G0016 [Candidatus Moranbacteria bacterium GW2011_GWE1_49_15]
MNNLQSLQSQPTCRQIVSRQKKLKLATNLCTHITGNRCFACFRQRILIVVSSQSSGWSDICPASISQTWPCYAVPSLSGISCARSSPTTYVCSTCRLSGSCDTKSGVIQASYKFGHSRSSGRKGGSPIRSVSGRAQAHQDDGRQDTDDRDNDQKLDQRETFLCFFHISTSFLVIR